MGNRRPQFFIICTLILLISLNSQPISVNSQINTEQNIDYIDTKINTTIHSEDFDRGLNLFGLNQGIKGAPFSPNNSYLVFMDMDGNIVSEYLTSSGGPRTFDPADMINSTTVLTTHLDQPLFWNVVTNETTKLEIFRDNHHDLVYNPETNTFLALEYYVDEVLNATGQLEAMLLDRITEYSMSGDILWEWEIGDYYNFSQYYENIERMNVSLGTWEHGGTTYVDPTHANTLEWDFDTNKIYLNLRHSNQFYQIDKSSGKVDWIAGQGGNFTMFNQNGEQVESLFYNAHDVKKVSDNEFILFDNGRHNVTDVEYRKSSLLHIKLDEENNEIETVYRYTAPQEYYSFFWGGVQLLENGNYMGSFGSLIHGYTSGGINYFTENFGGAAIEVDSDGNIVWELKVPHNWGFYRMQRVYPTNNFDMTTAIDETSDNMIKLSVSNVSSNFPDRIEIRENDELIKTQSWEGGAFIIEDLEADSVTSFNVTVFDLAGNFASVIVEYTPSGDDNAFVNVIFGSMLVAIPILVYFSKKK